jgi:hypothetical protein
MSTRKTMVTESTGIHPIKRLSSRLDAPSLWFLSYAFCLFNVTCHSSFAQDRVATAASLSYEKDVRPIFKAMCFHCHGEEPELAGGLDTRLVRLMQSGGDSGAAIAMGNASNSLLWQRIASDEMPEGAKKLSPKEKETIQAWIEQGAKTLRPEPDNVADARFTEEELNFWAFQPLVQHPVPNVTSNGLCLTNPIDSFVADQLQRVGLVFSKSADKQTLLRRITLDLHGLLPTREEIDAFVGDTSEQAYEKVVDRLLASPQFGVRWARHWLDVAGYSETDGNTGHDHERPYAWHYRDYVVNSINNDKPYNDFIVEQIAGDELIEGPLDKENDRHVELMSATGLMRMSPDVTATDDKLVDRNQAVADVIKVVSSSVLGLTVGCAQCHDHRYDPISIDDYYKFRAIFDPAFPLDRWQKPDERLVDMTSAAVNAAGDVIETEAKKLDDDIARRKREEAEKIQAKKLSEVADDQRDAVKLAVSTPVAERTEEQKKLLLANPMVHPVDEIAGNLTVYDGPLHEKFKAEEAEVAKLRITKPIRRLIMSVRDQIDAIPKSEVMFRGDPEQRKQEVKPSEIFVLSRARNLSELPLAPKENRKSTGRRLNYAQQLTDGTHPLVSRVAVNRLWQHHFGRGLVATPSDFGVFGQRPSHPELLDYLANHLVDSGWSMKTMHKMMVMSQTYQQQSIRSADSDRLDSENRLLSRMNLNRMDAEVIRDSMLFAAGKLVTSVSGPSVPVCEDGEGRASIGIRKTNDGLFAGIEDVGAAKYRRSVFLQSRRTLPLNMLETFDMPVMNPNCDSRRCSTVAPQSLLFLNDQSVIQYADDMAEAVFSQRSQTEDRVNEIFIRLFAKEPTRSELQTCLQFIDQQRIIFAADPNPEWQEHVKKWNHAPDVRALTSVCQTLMASNRFLYID